MEWIEYAEAHQVQIPMRVAHENVFVDGVPLVHWSRQGVMVQICGHHWGFSRSEVAHQNSKGGVVTVLVLAKHARQIVHFDNDPSSPGTAGTDGTGMPTLPPPERSSVERTPRADPFPPSLEASAPSRRRDDRKP